MKILTVAAKVKVKTTLANLDSFYDGNNQMQIGGWRFGLQHDLYVTKITPNHVDQEDRLVVQEFILELSTVNPKEK